MKIPYGWLREFVETNAGANEAAERLVMAGIEVGSVTPIGADFTGVVVGEVMGVTPHPAGGSLTVCEVSTGPGRFEVVSGAPNVRSGLRAAFAPPGAGLPGGRRIEAATVKGRVSQGMLCSEAELGLGEEAGVVLALDGEPVGADLIALLRLDDAVLDVEVTPNRPDCLSVRGVAREVAALTGGRLLPLDTEIAEGEADAEDLASVVVEDGELCPRYAARVITDAAVGPSPAWMAQRLRLAGLRPINSVVDVTNYVLWELGHPLHAFDADLVRAQRIVVRRARPGEEVVTLDGQTRRLREEMLVIADAERAVAVAGVMGGANTEVGATTRRVLLESAYFKPASVRRTAKTLGLATEASYRFERGADLEGLRVALDRAARRIAELTGGRVARGVLDVYPRPGRTTALTLRPSRITRVLGAAPPRETVGRVLQSLGFGVTDSDGDAFEVRVPSFRGDVRLEDDLVEEVARVWGYQQIPSTLPAGAMRLTRRPASLGTRDTVRRALTAAGCQEVVTLSLVNPAYLTHLGMAPGDPRVIALRNPLATDRSVLRPTLLFGLLEALATNARRQAPDARLFELGRVFAADPAGPLASEETRVGIAVTGLRAPRAWFADRARADVFDVKGLAESVAQALGRDGLAVGPLDVPYLEEGRGATALVEGEPIGVLGELHPTVQWAFDLPGPVFVAELSLDRFDRLPPRTRVHRPLPRFPAAQRDLAVVVPAGVVAADVIRLAEGLGNPCLKRVVLFDVYTGEQVEAGARSLAYSILYQAADRTLTDAEVNAMHGAVIERLRAALGAEVRGPDGGAEVGEGGLD